MKNLNRIVLVCDKNPCTSFGRLILDTKKALLKDFDVKIIWLQTPKYFPSFHKTEEGDESIFASSLYTGFFSFRKPLQKLLKSFAPKFVLFIRPELGFLVPVAKVALPSAKVMVQVHDTFAETLYPKSIKYKLINCFFIRNTTQADAYIYDSHYTCIEAQKHFKIADRPFCVLGCAINLELFHHRDGLPTTKEKSIYRESHQLIGFNGFCLNVSLDEPRKNLETFFEVARLSPQTAFVRIGKESPHIRRIIQKKQLKNVFHFTEISADLLRDFYRHADLLIFPSWLEGFGLPPLEALACGTAVVCSSTSALKENLEGVAPLISPPDNTQGYVDVLDKCLRGESVVDWEKAEALLNYFSLKSVSERLVKFLQTLV